MWQDLFVVPGLGFTVHGFGLMLLLACLGAVWLTAWLASRGRIDPDSVYDLATWLVAGGFIGARAMYLAQCPETIHGFWDIFKVWEGGITFYGCIGGGLIGTLIYWSRHPFPFRPMADAVAPALVFGAAVGRFGCFLNGCCYGLPCQYPWAVRFPSGTLPWADHVQAGLIARNAAQSLAVHPTQLYAGVVGLLIFAVLLAYFPRRRRDGEVMALLMILYPITRFPIESLRADDTPFAAGLTLSQVISLGLVVAGLVGWVRLSRLPRVRYADRADVANSARGLHRSHPPTMVATEDGGRRRCPPGSKITP
jgi:phosphatidylglycerol:prolipoprotein diacylglycerol transferase